MSASFPNRRGVLGFGISLIGWAAAPSIALAGIRQAQERASLALAHRMARIFVPVGSAARVGEACGLAATGGNAIPGALDTIAAGRGGVASLRDLGEAELHARLRGWIAEDWRTGATVRVHGWILSSTEARLIGLAATLYRSPPATA
jgi:hypothetical protein